MIGYIHSDFRVIATIDAQLPDICLILIQWLPLRLPNYSKPIYMALIY